MRSAGTAGSVHGRVPGDHVCWPFADEADLAAAMFGFLDDGLRGGERVVVCRPGPVETIARALGSLGDVEHPYAAICAYDAESLSRSLSAVGDLAVHGRLTVDLSGTAFVSHQAVRVLREHAAAHGAALRLRGTSPTTARVLALLAVGDVEVRS
jgi:anti-anti-sigma regulatory factor